MSHTTSFDGFSFIHNGDFSGEIIIQDQTTDHKMILPGETLMKFVAEIVRQKEIDRWQDMSATEILGLDYEL